MRKLIVAKRPTLPKVEIYTAARKAEFLLANAIGAADRKEAEAEVRKLMKPRRRQAPRRPR